ncbi:MAG: hypothetical protein JWO32_2686 [Bacteroidetes bacterium]|nr:hypothetical protein [Bacteroidota bacterium]
MKKINLAIVLLSSFLLVLSSCKKKFELPPKKEAPANNGTITIDSIYKKYISYYVTASPSPTRLFKFSNDASVTGTVTADEISGNIYKSVYIQDATGTLQVKLLNSGGLFVGDLIRINLRDVILDDYGKMVQLDSVDIEKSAVKISSGNVVTPAKATFNQLTQLNGAGLSNFQGKLVLLDSVEFNLASKNQMFSDPINKVSVDRILENSAKSTITVRTSGYANFAGNIIPCGNGSIVGIVSQFNGTIQLLIRDVKEVKLSSGTCPYLSKAFDADGLLGGGWSTYNVTGNINWTIGTIGGGSYANISNYAGSNIACETWLISPPVNLSTSVNPGLSFLSAYKYAGPALQVYVSTDYISGNPTLATWTALNPTLSAGAFAWTPSGNVSLSAYKTSNVRIGFKYSGTSTSGSTWELDNVGIVEF